MCAFFTCQLGCSGVVVSADIAPQTALWRCMSFMCACLERLWMSIAPVTHIAVDDHCSSAPLTGPWKSPWSIVVWSGGDADDDSRYTYTPVILLSPDLYRVGATMHKSISLALLQDPKFELSSPCPHHIVISNTEAAAILEYGYAADPVVRIRLKSQLSVPTSLARESLACQSLSSRSKTK